MTVDPRVRVISGTPEHVARVTDVLDAVSIRILVPDVQPTMAHQLIAVALTDLLGRLFPRLEVIVSEGALSAATLPPGPVRLAERLGTVRRNGGLRPLDPTPPAVTIVIGRSDEAADLYVDGNGWQSYIGRRSSVLPASDSTVPFGPLVAACRAAAHAFDLALAPLGSPRDVPDRLYSSLLGYVTSESPIVEADVSPSGRVDMILVGAGSIGGAAVYCLACFKEISGTVVVVDPENVEDRNPAKAILARHEDAIRHTLKVDVVREALSHHPDLEVKPHALDITEYHATLDRMDVLPLVLCAVDSAESRRAIQDCLPLELVNAACHPDDISVSRHVTDDGPCVCCLHAAGVLNVEQKRTAMIARDTGLLETDVIVMLNGRQALSGDQLRRIEAHRGMKPHALDQYEHRSLDDLWRERFLYAETLLQLDGVEANVPVATPFVTALAGFILAAEAMKPHTADPQLRLGPGCRSVRYVENPYTSPEYAQLDDPPRWGTLACLCRSPRRIRLMRERYGLEAS